MRVTNQQIMNQMLSDVKKLESQSSGDLAKGQVFKAVIREVMSDGLLLELKSGELLRSNLPQGEVLSAGTQHSFEVVENGKQLIVRPFSDETMESLEKTLEGMFKGTGEAVTPEKIGAAKALMSFGQPLNKESIMDLVKTAKQVDTFKGLIEANLIKLSDIPPKAPVKQILVAHYSGEVTQQNGEADLTRLLNESGKQMTGDGSLVQGESQSGETTSDQVNASKALVSENSVPPDGEKASVGEMKPGAEAEISEKAQTASKLLDLLKQVDFQKLAFHKSTNLNNSVQNLAMLDKLIFGKDSIGNQLSGLINALKDAGDDLPPDLKVLIEDLKGLGIAEDDKLDEGLMKVLENIESSDDKSTSLLNQAKDQFTNIQQSINYMKDISENMTYVQIPLQMDNELRSMDFFVKKKNKNQKSDEETTIFISLDTHTLDTVQVLLEYKKQNVGIQFRLSDQDVLDLLEENKEILDEQLSKVSEKSIDIRFRLKDKTQTNLDVVAEISSTSSASIDMKV